MNRLFPLLAAGALAALAPAPFVVAADAPTANQPVDYVRPLIGTAGHGHVYPGATVPHGAVQLSPDTDYRGWDWCSGYHYSDNTLRGFSHTHLSGTGCADLCDILFAPGVGPMKWEPGDHGQPDTGYLSSFSHDDETARAGYYRVLLKKDGHEINAELTATERVGIHRYTFPDSDQAHFVVDLASGNNSPVRSGEILVESPTLVTGARRSDGWVSNKTYYFAAEFSQPIVDYAVWKDGAVLPKQDKPFSKVELTSVSKGKAIKARLDFKTEANKPLLVKVGISAVSVEGAKKNLAAEAPDWNFDGYRDRASQAWNRALSRIQVEGADDATRQAFYTALYHTLCAPVLFNDADGTYRGNDGQVHPAPGFNYYSTFSTWDTFRAAHPLITLLEPERVDDMAQTFLTHFDHSKDHLLPIWTESGKENWCMIAFGSIPILTDAILKGLAPHADPARALAAMHATLTSPFNGTDQYSARGYIQAWEKEGDQTGTVSKTLELAYDDAAAARLAHRVGDTEMAAFHDKRAANWRNVFNDANRFIQPRDREGHFKAEFDPRRIDTKNYTEANGYHYAFFVPQDVPGLIEKTGGREAFVGILEKMFTDESKVEGDESSDASGWVGQYAQGNEPSHHMAYLFDCAGVPWKTQYWTREIMARLYNNTPEGLCGNEDCGQMSAWYALGALGFYPLDPTSGRYALGSPLFTRATLAQPGGKTFTLVAHDNSPANRYVQKATLNGQPWDKAYIEHRDIVQGATLELFMGAEPNKQWATGPDAAP